MPRPRKGARLWLRPERRKGGKLVLRATWIILDDGKRIATGCAASEDAEAEKRLAAYIAQKYQPVRKERDIEEIDIADVFRSMSTIVATAGRNGPNSMNESYV